jgi:hypothetical protein
MARQPAGLMKMLFRGARRHCARCGSGKIFASWFKMKERCPRCDLQFEGPAEEGFFLGAFTVNFVVTSGLLLLAMFGYIIASAVGDAPDLVTWVVVAAVGCVLFPILFYPFARSIWVAFEIAMHNMDASLKGGRGAQGHARGAGR